MVVRVFDLKVYECVNKAQAVRIVQITDLHLFAEKQQALLGINTWDSFTAVKEAMRSDIEDADLILVTGDVSQDRSAASYQAVCQALDHLGKPVHFLPGNHDTLEAMRRMMQSQWVRAENCLDFGHWQVVLLSLIHI